MGRSSLLSSSEGWRPGAFGLVEWALLLGTASIWGSSYLWIELGLRGLEPGVVSTLRVALGLVTVSLLPGARAPIDKADRGRIWLVGTGWFGLAMVSFPIAQKLGVASSVVGMLNGAFPVLTTLFASLLLTRLPRPRQLVGLVIGLAGLLAITGPRLVGADATAAGIALILGTMAANSLLANVMVPLQQRYGTLPVLRPCFAVALLMTLPFGALGVRGSTWDLGSLAAMLPLGVLSTGVAFVLWTTLIGRTGASRGSVVSYLVPVIAIGLGVIVLRETVTIPALVGTGAVLIGAWFVSGRESVGPVTAIADAPPGAGCEDRPEQP